MKPFTLQQWRAYLRAYPDKAEEPVETSWGNEPLGEQINNFNCLSTTSKLNFINFVGWG
jgi:hypothetical protein